MGKVPTWGLCAAFPQWYLADLLTGIISPHRLFLFYILRASKLQEHSYSKKKNPVFQELLCCPLCGIQDKCLSPGPSEAPGGTLWFSHLVSDQSLPRYVCVPIYFRSGLFSSPSVLKFSPGNMQFALLLEVPSFQHLLAMDPASISIFSYVT